MADTAPIVVDMLTVPCLAFPHCIQSLRMQGESYKAETQRMKHMLPCLNRLVCLAVSVRIVTVFARFQPIDTGHTKNIDL